MQENLLQAGTLYKTLRRRRIVRRTMGKEAIKKGNTSVDNIGQGSNSATFPLINVPNRDNDGDVITIRDSQNTSAIANVGDVLKYVHIILQAGNRDTNVEPGDTGWLEWAVTFQKETQTTIASTNLGVQTLGVIAQRIFRGDCLLTGQIPVGSIQPITQEIMIKIPKNKVKLQLGSNLILHTHFRSTDSTDVRTDNVRLVKSFFYKLYV